jgi:uncharacterized repeat protein (TIGR03803 family)
MNSSMQHRISGFSSRAVTIVAAFAVLIVAAVFATHSAGVTRKKPSLPLQTLYSFTGGADGANPYAAVIEDAQGNLYGTTMNGGAGVGAAGFGVVFEVSPTGSETVLYTFTGGADGGEPSSGLLMDSKGNLYGTTQGGGISGEYCESSGPCGVVFKLSPPAVQGNPWTETVLHTFTGNADGGNPFAGLIADSSGNLYGTTRMGGSQHLTGVVFKISTAGQETVLYNFCLLTSCDDGANPEAGLIRDSKGNLYGTTENGGIADSLGDPGAGTIFKLTPTNQESVLYGYSIAHSAITGSYLTAGVIEDSSGNLYGTTSQGGLTCGDTSCGVVFSLTSNDHYTVLHYFQGGTDGAVPGYGSLLRAANGDLYGTTSTGGTGSCTTLYEPAGCGIVFSVTAAGSEAVLYTFKGQADGAFPEAGLTVDRTARVLGFGTTAGSSDGTYGYGTVFEITR